MSRNKTFDIILSHSAGVHVAIFSDHNELHRLQIPIQPVHHPRDSLFPSGICLGVEIRFRVCFLHGRGHCLKVCEGRLVFFQQGGEHFNLLLRNCRGFWLVPLTFLLRFLDFFPAEVGHNAPFFQFFDQCLVLLRPLAIFVAFRKIFLITFLVDALHLSVNPAETEGLFQSLPGFQGFRSARFAK